MTCGKGRRGKGKGEPGMVALAFNTRRGTGRQNAMKSMQTKQWVDIMYFLNLSKMTEAITMQKILW